MLALFFLSTLICLVFRSSFQWTIDDGMIVARIARNFAQYGTLSFNPHEMISSATSPLYALVIGLMAKAGLNPVLSEKITGFIAWQLTGWLFYKNGKEIRGDFYGYLAGLFFLLFPSVISYSFCGLETPVYIFFSALTLFLILKGNEEKGFLTAACATVVRIDGIWLLLTAAAALFFKKSPLKNKIGTYFLGGIIITAFFGAHYFFYNSILPQSVIAKSQVYQILQPQNILRYLKAMFVASPLMTVLFCMAAAGYVTEFRKNPRIFYWALWYLVYHVFLMLRAPYFDWYLKPPVFVLLWLASSFTFSTLENVTNKIKDKNKRVVYAAALTGCLAVFVAANFSYSSELKKRIAYEMTVRRAAGEWMEKNIPHGKTVFTESLGYIGFFAENLKFIDWPGLISPRATQTAAGSSWRNGYDRIVLMFNPDYLALREFEWNLLDAGLRDKYIPLKTFTGTREGPGYVVSGRKEQIL